MPTVLAAVEKRIGGAFGANSPGSTGENALGELAARFLRRSQMLQNSNIHEAILYRVAKSQRRLRGVLDIKRLHATAGGVKLRGWRGVGKAQRLPNFLGRAKKLPLSLAERATRKLSGSFALPENYSVDSRLRGNDLESN